MANVAAKVASTGNDRILLTERGVSFGYNTLVTDMRSLPEMMKTGYPVVMDATHSVQQPGGQGESSGGQREFAPVMARAAVSLGVAAVFIETHEAPDTAPLRRAEHDPARRHACPRRIPSWPSTNSRKRTRSGSDNGELPGPRKAA
jgi:3-deoxy-8-phosphooctulonate synthase